MIYLPFEFKLNCSLLSLSKIKDCFELTQFNTVTLIKYKKFIDIHIRVN